MTSLAQAKEIGGLYCSGCKIPSSGITQTQIGSLEQQANTLFPSGYQPTTNDVIDICNGANCFRLVYRQGSMWHSAFGANGVSHDSYSVYVNMKAGTKTSGAVNPQPTNYDPNNVNVQQSGH